MVKEILTRWKLPMDRFWKTIQRICVVLAVVVPTTGELSGFIPEGMIPDWLKTIIGVMILLGILIPKFTVADKQELNDKVNEKS